MTSGPGCGKIILLESEILMRPKVKIIDQFVLNSVSEMIGYIREEYNTPEFDIKVRCDYSPHRRCSWGGRRNGVNFISLALNHYEKARVANTPITFNEYASFATNPVIGSVTKVEWSTALSALIAHEIAHAVSLGSIKEDVASAHGSANTGKHGFLWKTIYRKLRVNFVNNNQLRKSFIENHDFLAQKETPIITKIKKPAKDKTSGRAWYTKKDFLNGWACIRYFKTSDHSLIGMLSKRHNGGGQVYRYDDSSGKGLQIATGTASLCEARKKCFAI